MGNSSRLQGLGTCARLATSWLLQSAGRRGRDLASERKSDGNGNGNEVIRIQRMMEYTHQGRLVSDFPLTMLIRLSLSEIILADKSSALLRSSVKQMTVY